MQDMHTTTIMQHNERMLQPQLQQANAVLYLTFRPVLPSPIAMVQDVLVFCAIVRRTTMAY